MTKQEKIQAVKDNQMGSIYSKDDVIKLLEDIDDSGSSGVSMQDIEQVVDDIFIAIDDQLSNIRSSDCFDSDIAEFTIRGGNVIEIENLDIDFDHISTIINGCKDYAIDSLVDKLKLNTSK
jgi:hypothetical protein